MQINRQCDMQRDQLKTHEVILKWDVSYLMPSTGSIIVRFCLPKKTLVSLETPDLLPDVSQDILQPLVEGDEALAVVVHLGELSNPVHHAVLKMDLYLLMP